MNSRRRRATAHLLIGPVGAGKSTLAMRLAQQHRAIRFDLDHWMARLFRPDRPERDVVTWYGERAARCVEQIWEVAEASLELGVDVVLELGLLRRAQRDAFYRTVEDTQAPLVVHLVTASRDERRRRVEQRNQLRGDTFSMVVPLPVFELASDMWEPPDEDELRWRQIRTHSTDS